MFAKLTTIIAASAALVSAGPLPRGQSGSCSVTPHDQYSSSIGVLGCKINTNRIDSSGGAHDISYDAWNYLGFGSSASKNPQQGGGIAMDYEYVHASKCKDLMDDGKLPLAAANSMNYVASCLSEPGSWVAQNYQLYNINDPVCKHGVNEKCHLNLAVSNQPECPSGLGAVKDLNLKVENILYGSGKKVAAQ
ncbi:hypothetical protein F53441_13990 [Fusarium austroafricanum]|uniref:Ecp2 effector protein domain-containing protein n=1 Tax=Fusarium austroafricanum TaxID=2364996 RepID=A0A8H4JL67_9HYPO|nr:hypothetical protein F53441_13990 [Fusarium austroafricanum]